MNWIYHGRCWKFGDNVGIDGDMMPLRFAIERETDPMVLRDHLMSGIDPEFAKKVAPGDIIVGGKRFAQGNPHIQGFLGIRGHSLGLVAVSIPRGKLPQRNQCGIAVPVRLRWSDDALRHRRRIGGRLRDWSLQECDAWGGNTL